MVRGRLSTAGSSASGTLLHAADSASGTLHHTDSASGTLLHAESSARGMLLPAAGLPLFLRSRKSARGPGPADFIPDPFTTGLSGDDKLDSAGAELLESSELPAAARIQQEPGIRGGAMSPDIK
ncbi:MAG: hypothetical protein ACK56I_20115, partial [bacterium]